MFLPANLPMAQPMPYSMPVIKLQPPPISVGAGDFPNDVIDMLN